MNGRQSIQTDNAVKFTKRFADGTFIPDVVSGREHVRGIEANTKAFRLAHLVDDLGDVLESVAET